MNNIKSAIARLLQTEPFYAHYFLNCRIMYDTHKIPTAAVAVLNHSVCMIFNTEWMSNKTPDEVIDVIKHETFHLLLDHLNHDKQKSTETRDINGKTVEIDHRYIWNIAKDCVINQYLSHLPEGCVTLKSVEDVVGEKLEPFQTSQYYYDKLMKQVEKTMASGLQTLDDHDTEIEGDQSGTVMGKGAMIKVVKDAAKKAAGNVPKHVQDYIANIGSPKISWKNLLKNFVFKNVTNRVKFTNKKTHRRFDIPNPGKTKIREMTLGVCMDVSGSISDEQYQAFINEVGGIAKQIKNTYVIQADCEVAEIQDLKKKKLDTQRKAVGGTAYQPAISKCKELKCDVIVYFGDFDTADEPTNPGIPVLWVGTDSRVKSPGNFGTTIYLD